MLDNPWTLETTQCFMERLISDVEHYRSDLFLTFEAIQRLQEDTLGIVLTRRCGCELYTQETNKEEFACYDSWKYEAVGFYLIHRCHEDSFFGRYPAVEWQKISEARADRVIKLIKKGFKYPYYTGTKIKGLLENLNLDTTGIGFSTLEELGELCWIGLDAAVGSEFISDEFRDKLFIRGLEQVAIESGIKPHDEKEENNGEREASEIH